LVWDDKESSPLWLDSRTGRALDRGKKPAKTCPRGAISNVGSSLFENAELNKAAAEFANELMGESDSISDLFDRKREVAAFLNPARRAKLRAIRNKSRCASLLSTSNAAGRAKGRARKASPS